MEFKAKKGKLERYLENKEKVVKKLNKWWILWYYTWKYSAIWIQKGWIWNSGKCENVPEKMFVEFVDKNVINKVSDIWWLRTYWLVEVPSTDIVEKKVTKKTIVKKSVKKKASKIKSTSKIKKEVLEKETDTLLQKFG